MNRTRSFLLSIGLATFGCTNTSSEPPNPTPPTLPDLVLITLDTTRADRIGAYGDPLAKTPNLDRLARSSALFRSAWTPTPLTLPAHASMLTGRYPAGHGLRDNAGYRLSPEIPLVQEALAEAGYATGAFVSAFVLDGAWGLERGFDRYYDDFHPEDVRKASSFGLVERPARDTLREALGWWDANRDKSRFLWVHLFEPHRPYVPSRDWTGSDPYRGEIFEVDRALRTLLNAIDEDALLVVTADHGENLWDARELEHGLVLTRSVLRVPLLVRPPGGAEPGAEVVPRELPPRPAHWVPVEGLEVEGLDSEPTPDAPKAARVVETPVSLVDLAPTLLDYAGLPCSHCDGTSLKPLVDGDPSPERVVYAETTYPYHHFGWSPAFAARSVDKAYLVDPRTRLHDVETDPWWSQGLETQPPEPLTEAIAAWSKGWSTGPDRIDAETSAGLEALGYTTASMPTGGDVDLPPAEERIELLHEVFLAQGRMASAPEEAESRLVRVLERDAGLLDAWISLSSLQRNGGRHEQALQSLGQVLERVPDHPLALNATIDVLRRLQRVREALQLAEQAVKRHPEDARWHRQRIDLLGRLERPAGVRDACQVGLASHPSDPYLYYMKGLAHLQLEENEAAIAALNAAREAGSRAEDLELWLGQAHEATGDVDQAVTAYRAYARRQPRDVRPVVAAGLLLARNDRCSDALPLLFTAIDRGSATAEVERAYQACGGAR